jgi:hypothetical protein
MSYRIQLKCAAVVVCATVAVACSEGIETAASPSAVTELSSSALNADGSNLKVTAPIAVTPLFEQTNVSLTPVLSAIGSTGRNVSNASLSYRFQVSDSDSFGNIVSTGTGAADSSGVVRFTVDPALTGGRRYVWRVRAELQDAGGPWSNLGAFTTVGAGGAVVTTPGPSANAGPRPADPPPGQRLPLPDMQGVLARFSDASESCPRGLKYVNNPWQDRVIDAFRQIDSRWGYNGKPTKSADVDNNGVPVTAAGDEAAYHFGAGPSQGSFDVHLVDMLIGHCGSFPTLTWRVFTGEEPGFWSGAGRF